MEVQWIRKIGADIFDEECRLAHLGNKVDFWSFVGRWVVITVLKTGLL